MDNASGTARDSDYYTISIHKLNIQSKVWAFWDMVEWRNSSGGGLTPTGVGVFFFTADIRAAERALRNLFKRFKEGRRGRMGLMTDSISLLDEIENSQRHKIKGSRQCRKYLKILQLVGHAKWYGFQAMAASNSTIRRTNWPKKLLRPLWVEKLKS